MSEYYLAKTPDQTNVRNVHRDDCAQLPAAPASDAGLEYLGSFGNKDAAFSVARNRFARYDSVGLCPSCLNK